MSKNVFNNIIEIRVSEADLMSLIYFVENQIKDAESAKRWIELLTYLEGKYEAGKL